MSLPSSNLIGLAMEPLPPYCIGVMVGVAANYPSHIRAGVAADEIQKLHGIHVTQDDVQFVYQKIEAEIPSILKTLPSPMIKEITLGPISTYCIECEVPYSGEGNAMQLIVLSSSIGKRNGIAVEHRCTACGLCSVGHWTYRRQDKRAGVTPVKDLKLGYGYANDEYFCLVQGSGNCITACPIPNMRLVTGILLHARGSFRAAWDTFMERAGCKPSDIPGSDNAHKTIEALWFAWALANFIDREGLATVTWDAFWNHGQSSDEWLLSMLPAVRQKFVTKWAVLHVQECETCKYKFAIGLDGKRGAKRYLCAALNGSRRYIPEVDASVHIGCWRKPLQGGLYCKEHEDDDSSGDTSGACVTAHRTKQNGEFQYRVEERNPDGGADVVSWVEAGQVAKSLIRRYEVQRLGERHDLGLKKKVRRRHVRDSGVHSDGDQIMVEDQSDLGACCIDKASDTAIKKMKRRRLGGIIGAVSGCRMFLDWEEHQFGEGTAQTYAVLAKVVRVIMNEKQKGNAATLPNVVFMDNACALMKFATNPKRRHRTEVTECLNTLHYMLDIWHAVNHTSCLQDPRINWILDPRHLANASLRGAVNTEACEQAFSFLDRITYVSMTMGPGHFAMFLYIMFDLENNKVYSRRGRGAVN